MTLVKDWNLSEFGSILRRKDGMDKCGKFGQLLRGYNYQQPNMGMKRKFRTLGGNLSPLSDG